MLRSMLLWHLLVTGIFAWAFLIVLGHRADGMAGANFALAALAIGWIVAVTEMVKYAREDRARA